MSDWIQGNYNLSTVDMKHNAKIAATLLCMAGMSENSIAAILGNMQAESGINPGIWENLDPFNGGYGLVQWTPYNKYSDWWGTGWEGNGDAEILRIIYELQNNLQWISTVDYPMTFEQFWISKDSPEYLAQVFVWNYERPKDPDQNFRSDYAKFWYDEVASKVINLWYVFGTRKKEWWWKYGK